MSEAESARLVIDSVGGVTRRVAVGFIYLATSIVFAYGILDVLPHVSDTPSLVPDFVPSDWLVLDTELQIPVIGALAAVAIGL
ncbi:hypothetical protein E3O06_05630 [Cryobacterium glaciale]|uniref:Uncharacterized protein n=1 Tax=Cryobacterium glaciale TaxID=1259145 RepID=A0A4R8V2N3_9MICO|nr:hypothetical protein [Cryobacterium glaciale]TFB75306.1 hypothetical protein E3O06_05630 [Cryobacterium glaciale]